MIYTFNINFLFFLLLLNEDNALKGLYFILNKIIPLYLL